MTQTRTAVSFIAFLLLSSIPPVISAQSDSSGTESQRAAAQAKAEQEQREKGQAQLRELINGQSSLRNRAPSTEAAQKVNFFNFRVAIPKFRAAIDDLRWALGLDSKLEKSLKEIGNQTDVLLRYLESVKLKNPKLDTSEFKDYTQAELAWETLNSAERISAFLDFAVQAEQLPVVTPSTLDFMYRLNGELLRLKWLTGHVR